MKKGLKIYEVDFFGIYPVGNCCIIAAYNLIEAESIAKNTIVHTRQIKVQEMKVNKPMVIEYLSGDY